MYCGNQWLPPGVPCNGALAYGGYGTTMPAMYPQSLGGYNRCRSAGTAVGAVIGAEAKHHTLAAVVIGAVAGGFLGDMICENSSGGQVLVQVVQQPSNTATPSPVTTTTPGRCDFDNGKVVYTYEGVDGCEKARARMGISSEVKLASNETQPRCKPGTQWKKLNWEGHPQHNKFVCLPDDDKHFF